MLFKKKKEPTSPKEVINRLEKLEKKTEEIDQILRDFQLKSKKDLKKIGMVRFNPFNEIGGDQSFSLAVLDENDDGFVITSHYGREANRVYAKSVEQGKSKHQLSKEEEDAITKAIKS